MTPPNTIRAVARVRVLVEIEHDGGPWSADTTVAQVHKQAVDSARACLQQGQFGRVRIVGEPEVLMVTAELGTKG